MSSEKIRLGRREALKGLAVLPATKILGAVSVFLPMVANSGQYCLSNKIEKIAVDVAVIGSTPKQLEKAIDLKLRGLTVAVLDCRPKVGGGIHTSGMPLRNAGVCGASLQKPNAKCGLRVQEITDEHDHMRYLSSISSEMGDLKPVQSSGHNLDEFRSRAILARNLAENLSGDIYLNFSITKIQHADFGVDLFGSNRQVFRARQVIWAS